MIVAKVVCAECGTRSIATVRFDSGAWWWCPRKPEVGVSTAGVLRFVTADTVDVADAAAAGQSARTVPPTLLRRGDGHRVAAWCRRHPRASYLRADFIFEQVESSTSLGPLTIHGAWWRTSASRLL